MTLTDEHKRQIAQFMLIAEHYLSLAAPAANEVQETLGMTKHDFLPGAAITDNSVRLAIIGAHISSAAIRLASVEEVLRNAGAANQYYVECRTYFSGRGKSQIGDPRASTCSEWFHVMLRDNAAHEEPPLAPANPISQRRRARQTNLENTTFARAYSKVREIAESLRTLLEAKYRVVLPTPRP